MKLYAPTDVPMQIALTNGRTAVITKQGTDLPQEFWVEAARRGATLETPNAPEAAAAKLAATQRLQAMQAVFAADFAADRKTYPPGGSIPPYELSEVTNMQAKIGAPVTLVEYRQALAAFKHSIGAS